MTIGNVKGNAASESNETRINATAFDHLVNAGFCVTGRDGRPATCAADGPFFTLTNVSCQVDRRLNRARMISITPCDSVAPDAWSGPKLHNRYPAKKVP